MAATSMVVRSSVRGTLGLAALILFMADAGAASARVRAACESDYLAYCSQHDPDGPGVRRCMRANGSRLSTACLNALVAAGEVSRQAVARRGSRGK